MDLFTKQKWGHANLLCIIPILVYVLLKRALQNRNGLTDLENKFMVTKGEEGRGKLGVWD